MEWVMTAQAHPAPAAELAQLGIELAQPVVQVQHIQAELELQVTRPPVATYSPLFLLALSLVPLAHRWPTRLPSDSLKLPVHLTSTGGHLAHLQPHPPKP